MLLPELYGNEESKQTLCKAIKSKRMPQTLILEGDVGSGKKTFAKELAKAIFCLSDSSSDFPCNKCRRCERVKKLLTPDIVFVRADEDKVSISVDRVREMTAQAALGPCEMPALVFIIEEADNMNAQAQNASLLALENPPEDVVYILLCENSAKLLETIRSRAFTFRMERFSPQTIEKWIKQNTDTAFGKSNEEICEAASASGGSIGKAVMLLSDDSASDFLRMRKTVTDVARLLVDATARQKEKIKGIYSLPLGREALVEHLVALGDVIHDMIMLKLDENAFLSFFTEKGREEALILSDSCSLKTLYEYKDALDDACSALKANASVKGVRTNFAMRIGII